MTAQRVLQAFTVAFALLLMAPVVSLRAEEALHEIENSRFQAEGMINANAVYIRSGASENDYPTMKLDRGAKVVVTGIKFDWLKIAPPEGSYCYVAKAYVEKRGDGTIGRVTNALNVRVGSSLNAMKTKVAARLDVGDDVKILGEQDEYFKIVPPKSVYLYVNKQFVDLVRTIDVAGAEQPQQPVAPTDPAGQDSQTPIAVDQPVTNDSPGAPEATALAPDTTDTITPEPSVQPQLTTIVPVPATQPTQIAVAPTTKPVETQAEVEAQFDRLERIFMDNDRRSIDQQPLAEMLSGYEKLATSTLLPESLRRMSEYRVSVLKQRIEDAQRYAEVKKAREEMLARQRALQAEQEELEQRIKASGVKYFAAVGALRVSSLQQGNGTLYRLTDPKTGRTVVYVRSDDPKLGTMLNQFIGVAGDVQEEAALNLRVVSPTSFEAVDPSKVNITVAAQIVPPSLMPSGTASTGTD